MLSEERHISASRRKRPMRSIPVEAIQMSAQMSESRKDCPMCSIFSEAFFSWVFSFGRMLETKQWWHAYSLCCDVCRCLSDTSELVWACIFHQKMHLFADRSLRNHLLTAFLSSSVWSRICGSCMRLVAPDTKDNIWSWLLIRSDQIISFDQIIPDSEFWSDQIWCYILIEGGRGAGSSPRAGRVWWKLWRWLRIGFWADGEYGNLWSKHQ